MRSVERAIASHEPKPNPIKLSSIKTIAHTGITVNSLDSSLRFWVDGLGFTVVARYEFASDFVVKVTGVADGGVSIVMLRGPDHTIELVEYAGRRERQTYLPRPCDVGSFHLAFIVDDIEPWLERISDYGGVVLGAGQSTQAWSAPAVYARGPDGVTLEFIRESAQA